MPFRSPQAIVDAVVTAGAAKTRIATPKMLLLGFMAGAYIAFGGLLAITVGKGSPALAAANPGLAKLLFAGVFPVGIILVVIAGSELFTGNCGVIIPAVLAKRATWKGLLRNWGVVYLGNLLGSLFVALVLGYWAGTLRGGDLGAASMAIAQAKVSGSWLDMFLRAVGCNWLVCLAVWIAIAADNVAGKVLGMWFPVMAFVAVGFEHSVANMFFIPMGMFNGADVTWWQFLWANLVPVTLGNILGGGLFVGAAYAWLYGASDA